MVLSVLCELLSPGRSCRLPKWGGKVALWKPIHIFECNVFTSIAGSAALGALSEPKTPAALSDSRAPARDLDRVHVVKLRKLGQHRLALHGSPGFLRFESRAVVPARSSAHLISCQAARWPPSGRKSAHHPMQFWRTRVQQNWTNRSSDFSRAGRVLSSNEMAALKVR